MVVATTVRSKRGFHPRVTFSRRASLTTRSLSAARLAGAMTRAQRRRVVSSGTFFRQTRQNRRSTKLA